MKKIEKINLKEEADKAELEARRIYKDPLVISGYIAFELIKKVVEKQNEIIESLRVKKKEV